MTDEQLIEAVAVKVMGWCWHKYNNASDGKYETFYGICCICKHGVAKRDQHNQETWNPFTNWNDTMQIVDKMQWISMSRGKAYNWHVEIRHYKKYTADGFITIEVRDNSLQKAICLAALQALSSNP